MITYLHGDITTSPSQCTGNIVIAHCCNDIGAFGAGVSGALARKWAEVEHQYRLWHRLSEPLFALGEVQFVLVEAGTSDEIGGFFDPKERHNSIWVANLIGQHGIGRAKDGSIPLCYDALEAGLVKVAAWAKEHKATIVLPRIGCGLALGSWDKVEPIIERACDGLTVEVSDLG